MWSSLRRKIKIERMENVSFTTQQVGPVRSSQELGTMLGTFLPLSSDLSCAGCSWSCRPLCLSLCFTLCIAREKCPRQGRNLEGGLGWREVVTGCFAGVQHSRSIRSSPEMETDEKRERSGQNQSPAAQRVSVGGWSEVLCSAVPCTSYRQRRSYKAPGKHGRQSFMLSWHWHKWLLKVEIRKRPHIPLWSWADKFSSRSQPSMATLDKWFAFHRDWQRICSQEHRTTERCGWEGTFRGHLAQPPCSEHGYLQLDQGAQSPVQPGLECFQGWGMHHLSGQPVPVLHHPYCRKFLPCIQSPPGVEGGGAALLPPARGKAEERRSEGYRVVWSSTHATQSPVSGR